MLWRTALIYAGAAVAGYFTALLNIPLPWMIGPMVFIAAVNIILEPAIRIPRLSRPLGQTLVAGSVGLAFTPAALAALAEQLVAMVVAALLTVVAGLIVAAVLMRLTRTDVISASLSSVPGGPVEMANLAAHHGVDPGPVAFAQTLRIALIVLIFPPLLVAINGDTADPTRILAGPPAEPLGALLLIVLAGGAGLLFQVLRISNPFFLGPLAASAAATALLLPVTSVPFPLFAAAQVLLGVWLGATFNRGLFSRASGFLLAAFASTGLLLVLCALMAFAISALTGLPWQTMILATAPGSVTEMALTAKILEQGVAIVTAYHVVRIFIILPAAPLIIRTTARIAERFGRGGESQRVPGRDG